MINKVIITGYLSKYWNVRTTNAGKKMATFSIFQKRKDYQQYVPVLAFERTAEFFEKYVKDGDYLECEGRLSVVSKPQADGKKVTEVNFIAETINRVGAVETAQKEKAPEVPKDPGYPNSFPRRPERYSDDMWSRSVDAGAPQISDEELPF